MFAADYGSYRSADCIKNVWCYNLHEEFRVIRQVVQKYNWIAMDTEFPGIVVHPVDYEKTDPKYNYQLLRINVDMLKLIQLGLTFMDDNGNTPPGYCTWQFNFNFNMLKDTFAQDSIDLLLRCGIRFRKHATHGIDAQEFAELLMTSGLVLVDNVNFLGFHAGYDFGYLMSLLTAVDLPEDEDEFIEFVKIYFRNIYDVKHLMKLCKELHGGLQEVADTLELPRIGERHQAGSDSLLTGMAFFKIKNLFFDGNVSSANGFIHGLKLKKNQNIAELDEEDESACAN